VHQPERSQVVTAMPPFLLELALTPPVLGSTSALPKMQADSRHKRLQMHLSSFGHSLF
jgi:hypothetical protein